MTEIASNNKRIAKNTLMLYCRMLVVMLVSLYTSRVILNALGIEDYGIYQVVGGFVALFSVLSGSLTAAISRFITYELGTGDVEKLKRVFSTSVTIQVIFSIIILLLAETAGLWFLNQKVVVPPNRLEALNWCYQISIATFILYLISVPYNAAIIAHERMSAFAYIGIVESIGKLFIAYLVLVSPIDRLCFYALLMCVLSAAIRLIYGWYCKDKFEECRYSWILDKELLKNMFGFAGWNSIGAISWVLRLHGGTLLVNLFFGPSANAAKSIGNRVSTVVSSFAANFMTAINPQITKSYANGDRDYMLKLAYKGIRFSFFLILMLALPVLINTYYILYLWLKLVPDSAPIFVQLSIVLALTEVLSSPLVTMMLATGKIKKYQIIVGGLQMLNFPIAYLTYKMGAPVESIMIVAIILSLICLAARLVLLKDMIGLDPWQYIREIVYKVLLVTTISVSIAYYVNTLLDQNVLNVVLVSIFTMIVVAITSFIIGCTNSEQRLIIDKISTIASIIIK